MANVSKLVLASYPSDVIYLRRSINITHILEAERPKVLSVDIRIQSLVLSAVLTSSLVSNPHIVALPRELESWSTGMLIDHPAIS